jgi:hypothetical protein
MTGRNDTPENLNDKKSNELLTKLFFIVSLYVSFLFSGIFEEKMYKGTYVNANNPDQKIKFTHPLLAIFFNSAISLVISGIVLFSMYIIYLNKFSISKEKTK